MPESLKDLLISKLGLRLPTAELSPENERLYQELRKRELARPPQGILENVYDAGKDFLSGIMYDPTQPMDEKYQFNRNGQTFPRNPAQSMRDWIGSGEESAGKYYHHVIEDPWVKKLISTKEWPKITAGAKAAPEPDAKDTAVLEKLMRFLAD